MKKAEPIVSLRMIGALMALTVLPAQAVAGTLYLSFSNSGSNNASGSLNGASFSGASWALEYQVDDSVVDSNANSTNGSYVGAITGGTFLLNGVSYTLADGADSGNLYLSHYSTAYDSVSINPASGGYMQFLTNYGTVFPSLFSDVNSLASANSGTTVFDGTTDPYNNQSIINFQNTEDWFGGGGNINGIYSNAGDIISIYENSGAASGNFSVSLSGTSAMAVSAVPVPAAVWLFGSGLLGLIGVARRKK